MHRGEESLLLEASLQVDLGVDLELDLAIDLELSDDDDEEEGSAAVELPADTLAFARLQAELREVKAELARACRESDKQSAIHAITKKEMFLAQTKVDEAAHRETTLQQVTDALRQEVCALTATQEEKDSRLQRMSEELSAVSAECAAQVKLNASLTAQVEQLEHKGTDLTAPLSLCVSPSDLPRPLLCRVPRHAAAPEQHPGRG
jgi:hypothetical protein